MAPEAVVPNRTAIGNSKNRGLIGSSREFLAGNEIAECNAVIIGAELKRVVSLAALAPDGKSGAVAAIVGLGVDAARRVLFL